MGQTNKKEFRIGEKVRISSNPVKTKPWFIGTMDIWKGKIITVSVLYQRREEYSLYKIVEDNGCYIWSSLWFEPIEENIEEDKNEKDNKRIDAPEPKIAPAEKNSGEVIELNENMPEWMKKFILNYKAGISNFFILHGNINDLQKNGKGQYISLQKYLEEIFEQRELLIFYSISEGLRFANSEMEKIFRQKYLRGAPQARFEQPKETQSEAEKLKQSRQQAEDKMSLCQIMGGKSPEIIFPQIERILTGEREQDGSEIGKKVLIIDFAHNVAGGNGAGAAVLNPQDKINIETLERWARDQRVKDAGHLIILLTPHFSAISESLRKDNADICPIRIPKPDETNRASRWQFWLEKGEPEFEKGFDALTLGRLTNGLSLKQIDHICILARAEKTIVNLSLIKAKKQEILNNEFGDRLEIKVPQWGFDYFGGKQEVKDELNEIRDNILKGIYRRVPMGILATGSPGTGKTFLIECWAYECEENFIKIKNPRSMWLGESQRILNSILDAADDLAPAIILEDEADQSETSRDAPQGDSGVSNNLRQRKFEFCSDPKRRGKVIWVRISNRDDLLDAAYKRKGRTDLNIPFLLPSEEELKEIFKVMFKRYEIPTDIKDFSPFAKKTAEKIYCTGADVEWMVLEADKFAGREGKEKVEEKHLLMAIDDWEIDMNPDDIDRQTILAIKGSSKRLRPKNWQQILADAEARLKSRKGEEYADFLEGLKTIKEKTAK